MFTKLVNDLSLIDKKIFHWAVIENYSNAMKAVKVTVPNGGETWVTLNT